MLKTGKSRILRYFRFDLDGLESGGIRTEEQIYKLRTALVSEEPSFFVSISQTFYLRDVPTATFEIPVE